MTDLTPVFNHLAKKPTQVQPGPLPSSQPSPDEFLKEAYRIVRLPCPASQLGQDMQQLANLTEHPYLGFNPVPAEDPTLVSEHTQACRSRWQDGDQSRGQCSHAGPDRPRTRRHRLLHGPAPPQPIHVYRHAVVGRDPPAGNLDYASTQETRNGATMALGQRSSP